MKPYKMSKKDMAKGLCWKYALACILEISPRRVPNFVTKKSKDDDDRTRVWLKEKFKKGMVYLSINQFMESEDHDRRNPHGGPSGYSIMIISTDNDVDHAAIALDGKFHFNSCNNDYNTFNYPVGFYLIYDL